LPWAGSFGPPKGGVGAREVGLSRDGREAPGDHSRRLTWRFYILGLWASKAQFRFNVKSRYFPRPVPESWSFWTAGFGATPLLVWAFVAEPVVVPGFMLDLVASDLTLALLDAPSGTGWVCAEAGAVTPDNAAITTAEIVSLDRMGNPSFVLRMRK
jgi:hypothetical protein